MESKRLLYTQSGYFYIAIRARIIACLDLCMLVFIYLVQIPLKVNCYGKDFRAC